MEGQPIAIAVKDGKTRINGATVTKPDVESANGVIHPIDRVLVPPELSKDVVIVRSSDAASPVRLRPRRPPAKARPLRKCRAR